jgi:23S rRNA (pseudouridine1915-N3)-methyltransferase
MFDITILAIGKIKEPFIKIGAEKYLTMLKPLAKVKIIESPAASFNDKNKAQAIARENELIVNFLDKRSSHFIIIWDEAGQNINSIELAQTLDSINQPIIMVIGGSLGFDTDLKKRANLKLALGSLTFPHEIARLLILEQIYRAATISMGKTYHY